MAEELGLSPDHWNFWSEAENNESSWTWELDQEAYRGLWQASTYSLEEIFISLLAKDVQTSKVFSSISSSSSSSNSSLVSSGMSGVLSLEERSSVLFGRCGVVKVLKWVPSSWYLVINLR